VRLSPRYGSRTIIDDAEAEALLARAIKETEIGHCCYGEDPLPKAEALLAYFRHIGIALVDADAYAALLDEVLPDD
jgi:hypothetical protein